MTFEYSCLGISGPKFSGKDTFGRAFALKARDNGFGSMRVFFAKPIKEACCVLFGWTMEQLEDEVFKETVDSRYGITPRHAMVTLGTEWGRDLISENIWVNIAESRILATDIMTIPYITDLRFENESEMVRRIGGLVVHISDGKPRDPNAHRSEQGVEVKDGDLVFVNDKGAGMSKLEEFAASLFVNGSVDPFAG